MAGIRKSIRNRQGFGYFTAKNRFYIRKRSFHFWERTRIGMLSAVSYLNFKVEKRVPSKSLIST
jgi:hypothetical protein